MLIASGHEEACRPAREHGRSPSITGHKRCSTVDFSVVPRPDTSISAAHGI